MLLTATKIIPPGGYQPREDAIDIFISDLAFHAQKPAKPASLARNYAKYLKGGQAKRTHGSVRMIDDHTMQVNFNFDEQEVWDLLRQQNKSILRVYLPTTGLPANMAPDALEKLQSLQKKHIQQLNCK